MALTASVFDVCTSEKPNHNIWNIVIESGDRLRMLPVESKAVRRCSEELLIQIQNLFSSAKTAWYIKPWLWISWHKLTEDELNARASSEHDGRAALIWTEHKQHTHTHLQRQTMNAVSQTKCSAAEAADRIGYTHSNGVKGQRHEGTAGQIDRHGDRNRTPHACDLSLILRNKGVVPGTGSRTVGRRHRGRVFGAFPQGTGLLTWMRSDRVYTRILFLKRKKIY